MARRGKGDPIKVMVRRLKEGRGKGHGADYIPYLKVWDVSSHGFSTRVKGWKTGRIHHLLSNLELYYFYYLEWAASVLDIREQFPLPLNETLEIAARLKIRHPADPETRKPIVMTTDFVVDVESVNGVISIARAIKPFAKLQSRRVIEKLEIERTFWTENNIDWRLVTNLEINVPLARNMEILHSSRSLYSFPNLSPDSIGMVEQHLFKLSSVLGLPLAKSALSIDERLGLETGTSLSVAKYFLANQIWIVDMSRPLNFSKPLMISRKPMEA